MKKCKYLLAILTSFNFFVFELAYVVFTTIENWGNQEVRLTEKSNLQMAFSGNFIFFG